jgi:vacuolar-type H+-ATPase subunit H
MEKDILSEVIEVEKEIQKCLELEKTKAREWLEKVQTESADEFTRSEREFQEAFDRALADAEKEAMVKAAEIVREAEAQAERLRTLGNGTLQGIVEKQIRRILPG